MGPGFYMESDSAYIVGLYYMNRLDIKSKKFRPYFNLSPQTVL